MAMATIITIAGTPYNAAARVAARMHIDSFKRDLRGYDELAFSVQGGSPVLDWTAGTAVSMTVNFGSGALSKFLGEITDVSWGVGKHGWVKAYSCQNIKFQTDRIPITAPDLTGQFTLNRTPDDDYYEPADAGLTVGAIFTRVLTVPQTAAALNALGINYSTLTPPTLHATTIADLALLTVVPPQPVNLSGEGIFNILDQILARWMPKFVLEVPATGILRFKDTTDTSIFVPRTLTLPSPTALGDAGVNWPRVRASTSRCAGRVVMRGGPETAVALLSTADGTLIKAWSSPDEAAWTLHDFTQPGDGSDSGTVGTLTPNTAVVTSTDTSKTWASNFWPGREAIIYLTNAVASGIAVNENRRVTANTALTAGGTSTITWDASQPLDSTGYGLYRIVAAAGSKNDVSRLYQPREPHTGAVALATYVGAHLVVRSPLAIKWANNSKSLDVFYTTAQVVAGTVPITVPIGVEVLPGLGQFRLLQPAVTVGGNPFELNKGYPSSVAKGLPVDVQILAMYSRGALQAVVPPDIAGVPQYQGTAHSVMGQNVTRYIDVPVFTDQWSQVSLAALAQQHLDSIKDTVYEGSGDFYGTPGWDFLDFNYSLNYAIGGITSPWAAMNAPVRAVSVEWPQGTGYQLRVSFEFSTQRRPFSGDDLYLHPHYAARGIIGQMQGSDALWAGGRPAGMQPIPGFEGPPQEPAFEGSFAPGDVGRPLTTRERTKRDAAAGRRQEVQRARREEQRRKEDSLENDPHDVKMTEQQEDFDRTPGGGLPIQLD